MQINLKSYVLFFLGLTVFCSTSAQTINQSQLQVLEKAFQKKDHKLLDQFFENWHKEIPPISDSGLHTLQPIQLEAYKVFEAFYQPTRLEKLGGSENESKRNKSLKYLSVQDTITIYKVNRMMVSSLDTDLTISQFIKNSRMDTSVLKYILYHKPNGQMRIKDQFASLYDTIYSSGERNTDTLKIYRPKINYEYQPVIYNTSDYYALINHFLESQKGGIKKEDFLKNYISISHISRSNYLEIGTYPYASDISLDPTLTKAKVFFSVGEQGGEAIFEKENGKWVFVRISLKWNE